MTSGIQAMLLVSLINVGGMVLYLWYIHFDILVGHGLLKPSSVDSLIAMSATQMELLFLFDGNIIPNITAKFDNCISSGYIMTADIIEFNSQYRPCQAVQAFCHVNSCHI